MGRILRPELMEVIRSGGGGIPRPSSSLHRRWRLSLSRSQFVPSGEANLRRVAFVLARRKMRERLKCKLFDCQERLAEKIE